jgi:hypothetical protein
VCVREREEGREEGRKEGGREGGKEGRKKERKKGRRGRMWHGRKRERKAHSMSFKAKDNNIVIIHSLWITRVTVPFVDLKN